MKIFCSICIFDGGASDWISLKVVCSICISVERESDWIYEDHVLDPRSTPLSLHNSTSNEAWGKQPFLSIQIMLTFHDSSSWNFVYNIFLQLWILFILFTHLKPGLWRSSVRSVSLSSFSRKIQTEYTNIMCLIHAQRPCHFITLLPISLQVSSHFCQFKLA